MNQQSMVWFYDCWARLRRRMAAWRPASSPPRYAAIFSWDAAAVPAALYGAMLLRFNGDIPAEYARVALRAAPFLVITRLACLGAAGLHRWSFRVSGLNEAARLVFAMLLGSVLFVPAFRFLSPLGLPRAVAALEFFLSTSLVAGLRFAPRILVGWMADRRRRNGTAERAIIVGAGTTGDLLARDLQRPGGSDYFVVGFVDDSPDTQGMHVSGKPVLGTIDDLRALLPRHGVTTVLLAIPSMPAQRVRDVLTICSCCKVTFKKIPASYAHLDRRITSAILHELQPDDLLPRARVDFDGATIRGLIEGRRALVTGAGGSIGGEICRQLSALGVSELVMVDMNENELYLRARSLEHAHPALPVRAVVADIRELPRLHRIAAEYRPQLVFHAAAHKHVPLMEQAPEEAVRNNVFGTLNVALMADRCEAEQLVVISTDKAVNPTSVMGVSKRVAELVVRDLASRSATKMTAVRFGNVLGSAGSVVPLFMQQIARGGPVTLTDPECTRYFMTISEAVGLVLAAGLGGYGPLCVLDMGEPIRITDLAHNLITLAGRVPGAEIPIVYTGLRPGEKLHEELLTEDEEQTVQVRNRISVARSPAPPADLARRLHELHEAASRGDREELLALLRTLVPSYRARDGRRDADRASRARPAAPAHRPVHHPSPRHWAAAPQP